MIDKAFKEETLGLKKLLLSIKKECEVHENIKGESSRVDFVKKLQGKYYPYITKFFIDLTELVNDVDTQTYEISKEYLRDNIYDLIAGPDMIVNKQICEKPLKYAGDYIVADYFYKDGYTGKSLYGMLMDRYTVESPLARAHINRRDYLGRFIVKLAKRDEKRLLRVASLACGPAPEVFDAFEKGVTNIFFTLLDGEPGVIKFLKQKLRNYERQIENVLLVQENIINILRGKRLFSVPPQDLIYCAGFFDYIREHTATKLIRYMLEHLKPKGGLIVVNVSMDDVKNVYLKMIGEWDLYHRSKQDILNFIPSDADISAKKVLVDPRTGRNLYLVIKKG